MATIRVTLAMMGYPNVADNCLIVLQSLCYKAGYDLVLRNQTNYKNKQEIEDYFNNLHLPFAFESVHNPEIDVTPSYTLVLGTLVEADNANIWKCIDKYCLSKGIYNRNKDVYKPSYKTNTYFLISDYGESSQKVDSKPLCFSVAKTKAFNLINSKVAKYVYIVNSTTLRIMGSCSKGSLYEEFTEPIYYNTEL